MSTTNIQLLRSSIEQKRPSPGVLLDGQVALNINYKEPGLFFRLTNGQLTKVGPAAYTNDGLAPNSGAVGAAGNSTGEEWLDARISYATPILKLWDGARWTTSSGFTANDATGDLSIDRDLTCNILHADSIDLNDALVLKNDLLSDGNCQHNVGHDLARFNIGYFCTVDSTGNVLAANDLIGTNAVVSNETITKDLSVSGATTLGTQLSDQLTVEAGAQFKAFVTIDAGSYTKGDVTIGDALSLCTDVLTVNSVSTFHCDATFKEEIVFEKAPSFPAGGLEDTLLTGGTVIGDSCATSTLNIKAATTVECDILPNVDSVVNLGSPTQRFANMYTGDLHLKNDRGDWTVIEEKDYLSLHNNATGKTFRLVMEEV
jgi:hypothetical protein